MTMMMSLRISTLALLLISSSSLACRGGDQVVSRSSRIESQSCTGYGYCYSYGHNPDTGTYEYYYGYHTDCPGRQQRTVEEFICRNPTNGSEYYDSETGLWGYCVLN